MSDFAGTTYVCIALRIPEFFSEVEDFYNKFRDAVQASSCVGPVDDADSFCK